MATDDCAFGRVRHPATRHEYVYLTNPNYKNGKLDKVGPGPVCDEHSSPLDAWEVDGWTVVRRRYVKIGRKR